MNGPTSGAALLAAGLLGWAANAAAHHAGAEPGATPAAVELAAGGTRVCKVETNRPPVWPGTIDYGPEIHASNSGRGISIRESKTLTFSLVASDPDGDEVIYEARHLPAGASFDPACARFVWHPTARELGTHQLTVAASDGQKVSLLTIILVVTENIPPHSAEIYDEPRYVSVGSHIIGPLVRDPDGDPLAVNIKSLPPGARVKPHAGGEVWFEWKPTPADLGDHWIDVEVSDGLATMKVRPHYVVGLASTAVEQRTVLAPLVGYSLYATGNNGHGYHGVNVSLLLWSHSQRGDDQYRCKSGREGECVPSQVGFYLASELIFPTHSQDVRAFTYALGVTRAFEFGPERHWLIPAAGAELGGWVDARVGHVAQVSPFVGLHLWSDRHIWVDLNGGYRFVPAELRELSGPRATLSLLVNAW